jgi:hypothetical protein
MNDYVSGDGVAGDAQALGHDVLHKFINLVNYKLVTLTYCVNDLPCALTPVTGDGAVGGVVPAQLSAWVPAFRCSRGPARGGASPSRLLTSALPRPGRGPGRLTPRRWPVTAAIRAGEHVPRGHVRSGVGVPAWSRSNANSVPRSTGQ